MTGWGWDGGGGGGGGAHPHVYIIADPSLRHQADGIILIGAVDYPALRWQMGVCLLAQYRGGGRNVQGGRFKCYISKKVIFALVSSVTLYIGNV